MGMDLYLRDITKITPTEDADFWGHDILEDQANRFIRNGFSPELFVPTHQLKQAIRDDLIKEHGEFADWDYSIIGDPEHSWIQCGDGYLYEVTQDDITHIDEDTKQKLFTFKSYDSNDSELCYDRKPFRQYIETKREPNTLVIGNMTGISQEDSKYIYDTLDKYHCSFFSEDNDVYLSLTKFFNPYVPGPFRKPIEPGQMAYFCY